MAAGVNDGPDHYEAFAMSGTGTRVPAVEEDGIYVANKEDQAGNYGGKHIIYHSIGGYQY